VTGGLPPINEPMVFCPVCHRAAAEFNHGPRGRPDAQCVHCGALERHRFSYLLIDTLLHRIPDDSVVLDIGPIKSLSDELRRISSGGYISMDLEPAADSRLVDFQASLTALPLGSGSVGFLLCSHILEHIPDDAQAMAEIRRVLGEQSLGLIQLPRRSGLPTDEDPDAPEDERLRRFGQADHVRLYGYDLESRLEASGLRVATFRYSWILPRRALKLIGAGIDEEIWLVTTGRDPVEPVDGDVVFNALSRSLMNAEDSPNLLQARAEAQEWRSRYEWLHGRSVIKLGSKLNRTLKAATRPFRS
jgi:SAM-dependent methyltransferase